MATVKNNGSGRRLLSNMYRTILLRLNRAICLFLPCPNILLPNERRTRKLVACAFVVSARLCVSVCGEVRGGGVPCSENYLGKCIYFWFVSHACIPQRDDLTKNTISCPYLSSTPSKIRGGGVPCFENSLGTCIYFWFVSHACIAQRDDLTKDTVSCPYLSSAPSTIQLNFLCSPA